MRFLKTIHAPIKVTILIISLLAIIWRLSDFVEDVSAGAVKMIMGAYHVHGNGAILAQLLIIGLLALVVFITLKNILTAQSHRPQDS